MSATMTTTTEEPMSETRAEAACRAYLEARDPASPHYEEWDRVDELARAAIARAEGGEHG